MPPDERDSAYLWDILDASSRIVRLTQGVDRERFLSEEALRLSVTYLLQTIGEAASRLTADLRAEHDAIPWRKVIGQRNIIAHDYGHVDFALIWETVQVNLPILTAHIEALLPPAEDDA